MLQPCFIGCAVLCIFCIPQVRTGHRVAIIGSGPAGMAAADQLNKMGHEVSQLQCLPLRC
jgi:NADPH-dependent 2,4-dienoyl-CoA reductase/sulfur reductase-like enzyme